MLVHNLAGMCGIVGILKLDRRETPDGARLKRMRGMLRHRGPDGGGLWIDGPVGLGHGHGRLSIVDVAGGHQPMSNEDGAVWIHLQRGDLQPRRPAAPARGQRALLPDAERYRDDPEGCQRHPSILTAPWRRVKHVRNLVAEPHCRILR